MELLTFIALSSAIFTGTIVILVMLLGVARNKLVASGPVKIMINGDDDKSPTVNAGGTLLNVLSQYIPSDERIVTIENAAELQLRQEHVVTLESRPPNIEGKGEVTIQHLVVNSLRMRPDRIIVGEIRDKETAQLAIQAALTGHLVLSTIHTNNAAGVIPRLVDMGVDPFLIAPTLIVAIAQRLVRTLCPDTGKPIAIEGAIKAMIEEQFEDLPEKYRKDINVGKNLYQAESSSECPNGTRGRTAVMEILEMNEELEHVILTNPVDEEIQRVARSTGMLTMKEDGIIKSSQRIIPFEEVNTLGGELLVDEEVQGAQNEPATEEKKEKKEKHDEK